MTDDKRSGFDAAMERYLRARVSRSQALKAAAVAAAMAAIPAREASADVTAPGSITTTGPGSAIGPTASFPYFPHTTGTYTTETLSTIMNIAQTLEHLATTMANAGVVNAAALGISGITLSVMQATVAEEVYHVQFLDTMGAQSLTDTFTVPDPRILTDFTTYFTTLEMLETICVAAYMTATREFAELGQPLLAKFAYQAGGVEAEHRVMARSALALKGVAADIPPNNKAFETDLFLYMQDAYNLARTSGFIGGSGTAVTFPGIATALANAGPMAATVIQKTPNYASVSSTTTTNITGERGATPGSPPVAPGTSAVPGTGTP